jgi:cytochrome c
MRGIMLSLRLTAACVVMLATAACQPAPAGGDAQRGARLLAQYQCGACHVIPGIGGARGQLGPPLHGFGRRAYIAGHLPNGDDMLMRWIVDPRKLVPTTPMPSMGADEADARDMATYLLSLR